jgi:O-antigen ligase
MPLTRFGVIDVHKQPHNIFLDVLVTRGPFFLAGFIAVLYFACIQSMVAVYRSPTSAPFLIAAVYILLAAQWTGDFFDFRWFFLLTIPVIAAGHAIPAQRPPAHE